MQELTPQAVRFLFEELSQLIVKYRKNHFELGRVLHTIRRGEHFRQTRHRSGTGHGYENWESFCNEHLGRSRSWADGLCSNFEKLSAMELDENGDTFMRCMSLGWNKLNEVLRIAGNESNLLLWLDEAEGLSTEMLRLKISQAKRAAFEAAAGRTTDTDEVDEADTPTPRNSPPRRPASAPPADLDGDPDEPLSQSNPIGYIGYQVRFPDNESQEVFTKALRLIKTRYNADIGAGTAIGMMALHYVSTVPREAEGGAPTELEDIIRLMEVTYGVKLVVATATKETGAAKVNRRRKAAAKKKAAKKKRG